VSNENVLGLGVSLSLDRKRRETCLFVVFSLREESMGYFVYVLDFFCFVFLMERKKKEGEINLFTSLALRSEDKSDDETVETESFGENENENHSDEKLGLLSSGADTSVTNNSDGHTSSKTRKTDRETSTKGRKALEVGVV